jgi:hypothetical protein
MEYDRFIFLLREPAGVAWVQIFKLQRFVSQGGLLKDNCKPFCPQSENSRVCEQANVVGNVRVGALGAKFVRTGAHRAIFSGSVELADVEVFTLIPWMTRMLSCFVSAWSSVSAIQMRSLVTNEASVTGSIQGTSNSWGPTVRRFNLGLRRF